MVVDPCPISDCEATRVMELSGEILTHAVTGRPPLTAALTCVSAALALLPSNPEMTKAPVAPNSASRRVTFNTPNTPCTQLQRIVVPLAV